MGPLATPGSRSTPIRRNRSEPIKSARDRPPARRRTGRSRGRPRPSASSGVGQPADQGAADDQAVGDGGELADLLGRADPEADADRQVGLRPEPGDVLGQFGRQAPALAGDPGDRDVIEEAGRRPGDPQGPVAGRGRRDELDQPEVERRGQPAERRPTPRRAGRARSGRRSRRSTASRRKRSAPWRWMIAYETIATSGVVAEGRRRPRRGGSGTSRRSARA